MLLISQTVLNYDQFDLIRAFDFKSLHPTLQKYTKNITRFFQDIAILNVNTGGIAYDGATF